MYRLPIERWFTCVNQPQKPDGSLQIRSSLSSRLVSTATAVPDCSAGVNALSSLQRLQIGEQGVQIVSLERVRRHLVAGLDGLRIQNPAGKVSAIIRQSSRRNRHAAGNMRKIRAKFSARSIASDC